MNKQGFGQTWLTKTEQEFSIGNDDHNCSKASEDSKTFFQNLEALSKVFNVFVH